MTTPEPNTLTPLSKFTDEDLKDFGRRIAISARESLEAKDRGWVYLPSFQDAVQEWAALILNSVLISERQHAATQASIAKTAPLNAQELDELAADAENWGYLTENQVKPLIAQARAARPSPWQPASTAPKFGEFLALMENGDVDFVNWFDGEWFVREGPLRGNSRSTRFTYWFRWPSPPAQDGGPK